jgi:hypothetical protein
MSLSKLDLNRIDAGRFVTYANDSSRCFCQVRLGSGERILVSAAQGEIRVYRLALFGLFPRGVIGIFTSADLATLLPFDLMYGLFEKDAMTHPLDCVSVFMASLPSIASVRDFFHQPKHVQVALVRERLPNAVEGMVR